MESGVTATVALLGTCDTKLEELLYLRDQIERARNVKVVLIDAGRHNVEHEAITIRQADLLSRYGEGDTAEKLPRGEVIKLMSSCASRAIKDLHQSEGIHGIISAGGSGGTALSAPIMRDLPLGLPKLLVSTVASGDTGPIVGETDITMMYSVVDIAGLNGLLKDILQNAGSAIASASLAYAERLKQRRDGRRPKTKKRIGITMFGVTTPCVDGIRRHLESKYDVETYVFHATGHGGQAMERLIYEGELDAVIDLTTTEICDLVAGGVMSAGHGRLEAAVHAGIPNVLSLGATDMVNFGPKSSVPERYRDRNLYEHNPVVTLMRTSEEECRKIGEFICEKLKKAKRPELVQVWIPSGGVSMISTAGGPFEDRKADAMLFDTLRVGLKGSGIQLVLDERDVNDPEFAKDIAEAVMEKMNMDGSAPPP